MNGEDFGLHPFTLIRGKEEKMDHSTRQELAVNYFSSGYNCCQSLVLAFADLLPANREMLSKIACSFGGGMGRLREVCGAVSGMFFVIGLLYGYSDPETGPRKAEHYARIQDLAHQFEEKNGSIICRELLGLACKHDSSVPAERTAEYYRKRPCKNLVGDAAEILDRYISEHPPIPCA